jgi:ribonuclease J
MTWAAEELRRAVESLSKQERADDEKLRETVRIALRRALDRHTGKKPLADVHVIRV